MCGRDVHELAPGREGDHRKCSVRRLKLARDTPQRLAGKDQSALNQGGKVLPLSGGPNQRILVSLLS
jgi:hypothetical protein